MSETFVRPVDMGANVWMLDLLEQGVPCRTAAYLMIDEKVTLIETGSAASHDILVRGMAELGVRPTDLTYVIVTHVHLDHAGGAGQLMAKANNATLVVHPRGERHMVDPTRLWQGATDVYGSRVSQLFGSVMPVPATRVMVREHGDTLDTGNRLLTFFDSPGHAKHHFTIHDPLSKALFAGDAVGIRYRTCFTGWDFEWVMPSTSPVDFDPIAVRKTIEMLQTVPFEWVYHAHFGRSEKAEACEQTLRCAEAMARFIGDVYTPGIPVETVIERLRDWIRQDLQGRGYLVPNNIEVLDIDVILDALGLMHFETKRRNALNAK